MKWHMIIIKVGISCVKWHMIISKVGDIVCEMAYDHHHSRRSCVRNVIIIKLGDLIPVHTSTGFIVKGISGKHESIFHHDDKFDRSCGMANDQHQTRIFCVLTGI